MVCSAFVVIQAASPLQNQLPTRVRPLDLADLPALHAMAVAAEAEGFQFVTRWLAELTASQASFETPTSRFLGVELRGRLIAFGGVTPDPYAADERIGRLRHVYVSADARRERNGTVLVSTLEAWARDVYATLRLRTDTVAAARFYERLGYLPIVDRHATHERLLGEVRSSLDDVRVSAGQ